MRTTGRRLAMAAALVLLAGCGGGGGNVTVAQAQGAAAPVTASGPSPAPETGADQDPPQVLGGDVTVAPEVTSAPAAAPEPEPVPAQRVYADEPQCPDPPPGVAPDDAGTPELHDALQEILEEYETKERGQTGPYYTGLVSCQAGNFATMFRVPGGAAFDAWVRDVARRHGVVIHLRDTKYSRAAIERTRTEVKSREAALERAGGRLGHTAPQYRDGAYLEVGVHGDRAAARRVLADLGDRIRVVVGMSIAKGSATVEPNQVPRDPRAGSAPAKPAPVRTVAPEPPAAPALDVTRLLPPAR